MITSGFWRNGLGRKIVTLMIAASAVLSIGAAGVQLYTAYQRDQKRALDELTVIDTSFRAGLESALWHFDHDQVEILLNGILAQADIVYINLATPTEHAWEKGAKQADDMVFRNFELFHQRDAAPALSIGTLNVGLSLAFVKERLWEQFWTLALSNFMKTLLATMAMLFIFDRVAARHLRSISAQARSDWLLDNDLVHIDRRPPEFADELDDIAASLNQARATVRASHAELREKMDELAALNSHIEEANREQAEFTYAISHDMKSPTNTVRMLLEELRRTTIDHLDEDAIEILDDLQMTNTRMRQLVEDVLSYSRSIEDGMTVEMVDLSQLVGEIVQDLAADIAEADAKITVGPLPKLCGNAAQLRMLLQNIISNAIKFRHANRRIEVGIETTSAPTSRQVAFKVSDNGIGIDPEHHARIFGLFKRLHAHGVHGGSGIGLTVCQRIVSNHGGQIDVSSQIGVGSTFTIVLSPQAND